MKAVKLSLLCALVFIGALNVNANTLEIAYNENWPPYSYINEQGEVVGQLVRVMNAILDRAGISYENFAYPWARAQKLVKQGTHDALVTVWTEERQSYTIASRNLVFCMQVKGFANKQSDIFDRLYSLKTVHDFHGLRVCDMLKNGWSEEFYARAAIPVTRVSSVQSCIQMIDKGYSDIIVHPVEVIESEIVRGSLDNLVQLPALYDTMDFSLLIEKNSFFASSEFLEAFDSVLDSMRLDGSFREIRTLP